VADALCSPGRRQATVNALIKVPRPRPVGPVGTDWRGSRRVLR
jgi:hypothetical protein